MQHRYLLLAAGALAAACLAGCQPKYVLDVYSTMRYDVLALPAATDTMRLTAVDFISAREGFVGGAGGAVFATANGGQSWARRTAPTTTGAINKLVFSSATTGWAGTTAGFFRTANGGQSWQPVALYDSYLGPVYDVQDVQFVTAQVGYAVGGGGGIFKTTNGGGTWGSLQSSRYYNYTFRAVSFTSADSGTVAGDRRAYWLTTNGGRTWAINDEYAGGSPLASVAYDVLRQNASTYQLATPKGFLACDAGSGGYGREADENLGFPVYGLAGFGARGPVVGVGEHTLVRRHDDFSLAPGRTPWANVHQPDGTSFAGTYYAADFADAATFYAVGAHGLIHRFHYQ